MIDPIVDAPSPGAALLAARRAAGISLQDVARRSRVPLSALEALEGDRFDDIPAMVYVRGFMRLYAREVRLDPGVPLGMLEAQISALDAAAAEAEFEAERTASANRMHQIRTAGGYTAVVAALIAVVLGALFSFDPKPLEAKDLRSGEISAAEPAPASPARVFERAERDDHVLALDPSYP